jgi:hypothetical protein
VKTTEKTTVNIAENADVYSRKKDELLLLPPP